MIHFHSGHHENSQKFRANICLQIFLIAVANILRKYITLTLMLKDYAIDPLPFPLKATMF